MIEEAYVSVEVAKLLREKGFDEECNIPTLQMVCEWLRQEAAYHVEVLAAYHFRVFDGYTFEVFSLFSTGHVDYQNNKGIFKTANKACEAGIKFCLERLPNKKK